MYVAKTINTDHKDLIHDVAFDFYGRRMATCSSDQIVKIWDLNENGEWNCSSMLKSHNGSVWKVTWAHPEFGQIIATCSFDRTAIIFEENVGDSSHGGMQTTWFRRASLVDSRSSVTDVKFAPKSQGLQLATCSADGVIRIYEANDVMNLCHWPLMHEIQTKLNSCSCISWNPSPSRLHPPLIAVGSDDSSSVTAGKVLLYEFSEQSRKWAKVDNVVAVIDPVHDVAFAPNLGRSYHLLAVATKDVRILAVKPVKRPDHCQNSWSTFEIRQAGQFNDHGSTVWRVSWNMTGTILASSGDDGCVRMWKANYLDVWKCIAILKGDTINCSDSASSSVEEAGINVPASNTALQPTLVAGAGRKTFVNLGNHSNHVAWH